MLRLALIEGEDIELLTHLHSTPLHVKADPSQIEQVIMNLIVNARDAMPEGGAVTVQTTSARLDPATFQPVERGGRAYAVLAVTDTGIGMDEHVQRHLFEPFFTTKEQGKGTGLGLAMVYGVVQQSEGHIEVVSAPGRGATFKIYLPLTTEGLLPSDRSTRSTQRLRQQGTETVLLVEDEDGVRALARTALQLHGYKVLECSDGAQALALCEQGNESIDILVTDVVMPGLGGVELARRFMQCYPAAKILFMSGYPDRDLTFAPDTASSYIQKPFSPHELTARVRALLDARPALAVAV